jgi:uncharacterized protein YutE (UPF0331/DUF86 family)
LVDSILVMRKLSEMEQYLGQIREYASLSLEEYGGNWRAQRIVERTLHLMIELCIDIANHFISDKVLRVPVSYADSFKVLEENGLINTSTYEVMSKMAKFRNIIVHHYEKIDAAIMVTILKRHLDDFLLFRDAVVKQLPGGGRGVCL